MRRQRPLPLPGHGLDHCVAVPVVNGWALILNALCYAVSFLVLRSMSRAATSPQPAIPQAPNASRTTSIARETSSDS